MINKEESIMFNKEYQQWFEKNHDLMFAAHAATKPVR
jgi:hypothetical protein